MPVQKYPWKVTKIDWYDYISRGENNLIYRFMISAPQGQMFSWELGGTSYIFLTEQTTGDKYDIEIDFIQNGEFIPQISVASFSIPSTIPPGKYYVQLKWRLNLEETKTVISIPTSRNELEVTILDTEFPQLRESDRKSGRKLTKEQLTWPEAPDENN